MSDDRPISLGECWVKISSQKQELSRLREREAALVNVHNEKRSELMATKNSPGRFDCYANAKPDEPMFVLLARDKYAPTLVRLWALLRHDDGEDAEKVQEALMCATSMDDYKRALGGDPSQMWSKLEPLLLAATEKMDDHPDDYNHACLCSECRSCG